MRDRPYAIIGEEFEWARMKVFFAIFWTAAILIGCPYGASARDFVEQSDISSCGPDVLREVLRMRGLQLSDAAVTDTLATLFPNTTEERSIYGASFSEMSALVSYYLGQSAVLSASTADVVSIVNQVDILIAIKTQTTTHFVVLSSIGSLDEVMIIDPLFGPARVSVSSLLDMLKYGNPSEKFTFVPLVGSQVGRFDSTTSEDLANYNAVKQLGGSSAKQTFTFGIDFHRNRNRISDIAEIESSSSRAFIDYLVEWASASNVYSLSFGMHKVDSFEILSISGDSLSYDSQEQATYFAGSVSKPFSMVTERIQIDALAVIAGGMKGGAEYCFDCGTNWLSLGVDVSFAVAKSSNKELSEFSDSTRWYHELSSRAGIVNGREAINFRYGINRYDPELRTTLSGSVYALADRDTPLRATGVSFGVERALSNDHSMGAEVSFARGDEDTFNPALVVFSSKEVGLSVSGQLGLSSNPSVDVSLKYSFQN